MKITFIEPPPLGKRVPERFAGCSFELYHFPDLANLYVLAVLHEAGYEVAYVDAILEKMDERAFLRRIAEDDSDYYVLHSVVSSKRADLYYMDRIRALQPGTNVIVHGPEPTRVPEEYLSQPSVVDRSLSASVRPSSVNEEEERRAVLVFRGEIEDNVLAYLRDESLCGISRWEDGRIVHHPPSGRPVNLDVLPFIPRRHKALEPYVRSYFNPKFKRRPYTIMMASRGCAFRCLFCVPNSISFARELEHKRYVGGKPGPQMASAERVVEEFRRIKAEGFQSVMVVDDQFLWGASRTLKICAGIADLGLEWGCLSRADFLTEEEVIEALARAGCVSVDIGVESLDQGVLDDIQKDLNVEVVYEAVRLLKSCGIQPKLNIMIGTSPREHAQGVQTMVKQLQAMDVDHVMFSIVTPFKGTEFYQRCKARGVLWEDSEAVDPLGRSLVHYPHLSAKQLERLARQSYRSFYLRPRWMARRLHTSYRSNSLLRDLGMALRLIR